MSGTCYAFSTIPLFTATDFSNSVEWTEQLHMKEVPNPTETTMELLKLREVPLSSMSYSYSSFMGTTDL